MARCLVGRLFLFLGCLLLLGIVIRLVMAVFAPVILEAMQQGLVAGWEQLSGIMGPAIPAIAALVILAGFVWIIIGYSRSRRF